MCSTSLFPSIMTKISKFTIFFIFQIFFFQSFLYKYDRFLHFHMVCADHLLKLIILISCFIKDSQNFCRQSLALYTSYLFSMLLNEDIVDIEKPDGTYLPTFAVDEFSELILH